MQQIYELADQYADEFMAGSDFGRLLELKKWIKEHLASQIVCFKTAEAKYLEAKQYGRYHPNLEEYQRAFVLAKAKLYQEEAVSEYLKLEAKLQRKLDEDLNELKKSISNKFTLNLTREFFKKDL